MGEPSRACWNEGATFIGEIFNLLASQFVDLLSLKDASSHLSASYRHTLLDPVLTNNLPPPHNHCVSILFSSHHVLTFQLILSSSPTPTTLQPTGSL